MIFYRNCNLAKSLTLGMDNSVLSSQLLLNLAQNLSETNPKYTEGLQEINREFTDESDYCTSWLFDECIG